MRAYVEQGYTVIEGAISDAFADQVREATLRVEDFIAGIERYLGAERIDFVTCNGRMPDQELLDRYSMEGEYPVPQADERPHGRRRYLSADLVSRTFPFQKAGDPIKRTLIRHDADALAALIIGNCIGGV